MVRNTLKKFKLLPKEARAMVKLYWVYEFAEILIGVFIGIFIFLQTNSLLSLALYNLVYFSGIVVGFSIWGYIMSLFKISMRFNYIRAFVTYVLSFMILIFLPHTEIYLLLFGLINGIGLGMFWVGVHSFEILYTDDHNRDFYSSMTSTGSQVFSILGPAVATLTFYISEEILHIETFKLLFAVIPFVYALSLPYLFSLPDFIPEKVSKNDLKKLIKSDNFKKALPYFSLQGLGWGIISPIYPLITISVLGTVINVGLFETIIGALSIAVVIYLSHHRHEGNRIQIMKYAVIVEVISYSFMLLWKVHPLFFIIYHLMRVLVYPIYRVSEHVIDLKTIEASSNENGFFAPIIARDFALWLGRVVGIGIIVLTVILFGQDEAIFIGIILMMIINLGLPIAAEYFLNHIKK